MSHEPRIMIHIVAYNAAKTLAKVLDRIPQSIRDRVSEICVFDDASKDDTFLVGKGYQQVHGMPKLSVFRNAVNRGYGGNQKLGYRYAMDKGYDIVVLLHGDGQYAPEAMPELIQPIIDGEADAVFGSRMLEPGAARRGGMPLYKYLGNRVLTTFENRMLGMNLSEFHSGYRVYSVKALAQIPFEANSNDFHFDTQIIIQMKAGGFRIKEVPIPTYYGDEICHVNGMKYARDVAKAVFDFRRHEAGLIELPEYAHARAMSARYTAKESPFSSHHRIVEAVRPGSRVLDVGCAGGYIARVLKDKGCFVVGVDDHHDARAEESCDHFYVANLDGAEWSPPEDVRNFDYVIFGDVLEHLRDTTILKRAAGWLGENGRVIASTGNIALWYVRMQLLRGKFKYTPRGILDDTHVHLYTRETFRELVRDAGFRITAEDYTVIPLERLIGQLQMDDWLGRLALLSEQFGYQLAQHWPELFAYQFVLQAERSLS